MTTYVARGADGICKLSDFSPSPDDGDDDDDALTGTVGEGGNNADPDVRDIQSRLNSVATADGGPSQALVVDGICGTLTKTAIRKFQQRYAGELVADGRIDPGKATWTKLAGLSTSAGQAILDARAPAGGSSGSGGNTDPDTQLLWANYLFLARWRVFEAIKSLDEAKSETEVIIAYGNLHPDTSFPAGYNHWEPKLKELPTLDRCFHLIDGHAKGPLTLERIKRIRKVFADMLDVIVANAITTPAAQLDGSRAFLRVTRQATLDHDHPEYSTNGVIADAALGGWSLRNANVGRIRYGTAFLDDGAGLSTLIHELAHFVSHQSTYMITDAGGYYHKAFNAIQAVALRTAECYSWYALLASFKHLRTLSNQQLPIDV